MAIYEMQQVYLTSVIELGTGQRDSRRHELGGACFCQALTYEGFSFLFLSDIGLFQVKVTVANFGQSCFGYLHVG